MSIRKNEQIQGQREEIIKCVQRNKLNLLNIYGRGHGGRQPRKGRLGCDSGLSVQSSLDLILCTMESHQTNNLKLNSCILERLFCVLTLDEFNRIKIGNWLKTIELM